MAKQPRPSISDAEREVLKSLWELGPSLVRDLLKILDLQGQQWSRSTVITLLQRLEKKGYVASDRSNFAFCFRAIVNREELAAQKLNEVAGELYAGNATPMVLAFAEQHSFSDDEIKQLRQMIDQMSKKPSNKKKKQR